MGKGKSRSSAPAVAQYGRNGRRSGGYSAGVKAQAAAQRAAMQTPEGRLRRAVEGLNGQIAYQTRELETMGLNNGHTHEGLNNDQQQVRIGALSEIRDRFAAGNTTLPGHPPIPPMSASDAEKRSAALYTRELYNAYANHIPAEFNGERVAAGKFAQQADQIFREHQARLEGPRIAADKARSDLAGLQYRQATGGGIESQAGRKPTAAERSEEKALREFIAKADKGDLSPPEPKAAPAKETSAAKEARLQHELDRQNVYQRVLGNYYMPKSAETQDGLRASEARHRDLLTQIGAVRAATKAAAEAKQQAADRKAGKVTGTPEYHRAQAAEYRAALGPNTPLARARAATAYPTGPYREGMATSREAYNAQNTPEVLSAKLATMRANAELESHRLEAHALEHESALNVKGASERLAAVRQTITEDAQRLNAANKGLVDALTKSYKAAGLTYKPPRSAATIAAEKAAKERANAETKARKDLYKTLPFLAAGAEHVRSSGFQTTRAQADINVLQRAQARGNLPPAEHEADAAAFSRLVSVATPRPEAGEDATTWRSAMSKAISKALAQRQKDYTAARATYDKALEAERVRLVHQFGLEDLMPKAKSAAGTGGTRAPKAPKAAAPSATAPAKRTTSRTRKAAVA